MELLAKINGCFNTLGEEHKTRILLEFSKNLFFVDNQIDIPRLYNMCMEAQEQLLKSKDKNLVQEDSNDDETVALIVETKKILEKLGKEKKTMILKESVNLPGDDLDFVFIHDRALAELAKIKGKSTIFKGDRAKTIPRIHKKEVEKQKLLHDAIKIDEKRGRSDEDGDYEIDFQLLQKKAMEEPAAIKGKKPISEPGIHHEKADKEKLLHGAIEIGKKRFRYYEDDDYEPQEKAIMKRNIVVRGYDLPEALKQIMARVNGSKPVLVIQKQLSSTDVNPHNARLSLPLTLVDLSFLSQTQRETLFEELPESHKKPRIEANLLEPNGNISNIFLARWDMNGGAILNLVTTWKDVVKRNRLRERMWVQLWSFQAGSQFWLALFTI